MDQTQLLSSNMGETTLFSLLNYSYDCQFLETQTVWEHAEHHNIFKAQYTHLTNNAAQVNNIAFTEGKTLISLPKHTTLIHTNNFDKKTFNNYFILSTLFGCNILFRLWFYRNCAAYNIQVTKTLSSRTVISTDRSKTKPSKERIRMEQKFIDEKEQFDIQQAIQLSLDERNSVTNFSDSLQLGRIPSETDSGIWRGNAAGTDTEYIFVDLLKPSPAQQTPNTTVVSLKQLKKLQNMHQYLVTIPDIESSAAENKEDESMAK